MKKISLNLKEMTKVMSEMELKNVLGGADYGLGGNTGSSICEGCPCRRANGDPGTWKKNSEGLLVCS